VAVAVGRKNPESWNRRGYLRRCIDDCNRLQMRIDVAREALAEDGFPGDRFEEQLAAALIEIKRLREAEKQR
jgi:hypothetical protein